MIELTFQGAVATRATTNTPLEQHGPRRPPPVSAGEGLSYDRQASDFGLTWRDS